MGGNSVNYCFPRFVTFGVDCYRECLKLQISDLTTERQWCTAIWESAQDYGISAKLLIPNVATSLLLNF